MTIRFIFILCLLFLSFFTIAFYLDESYSKGSLKNQQLLPAIGCLLLYLGIGLHSEYAHWKEGILGIAALLLAYSVYQITKIKAKC